MRLVDLVETSQRVGAVSGRLEKIEHLATLLRRAGPEETEIAVSFLTGRMRQGRIGIGWAALREARPPSGAEPPTLTLREVDETFSRIAGTSGKGSTKEKGRLLHDLLTRATSDEQTFLSKLIFGELRQGALEGVMAEAIAKAADIPAKVVRRAVMAEGDMASVAKIAMTEGAEALEQFGIQLFRPVQPMLASPAEDVGNALERLGEAALEYKLDGARVQIHKQGDEIKVYSRRLREVTHAVPEIVEITRALPARELVLDGEVIALRANGTPLPFQVTMRRFGRKIDVEKLRETLPLTPFLFDILYLEGDSLIDEPQSRRAGILADRASPDLIVPRTIVSSAEDAAAFLNAALKQGHEGIMAKARDAAYEAGSRGFSWLKVKPTHTLDLVVLAVEWGSGRRKGWLSNIHLGARDPEKGAYVMLGKTFKGMTDEMLRWQTKKFLELEIGRDDYTVHVRPEVVAEIAFNDIQASPHYPGGLALRFARVKRYRSDKTAEEADTIHAVRELYRRTTGEDPPVP